MALAMHMPVARAARFLGIEDKRLWRVIFHYVDAAVARMDLSGVKRVAIDETAAKRGHDYITLVVDVNDRRVVFVADGRSADTVRQFADHLEERGGDASRIKQASIDMSPAFIAGVTENLTEAGDHLDRFHVMKLIGDAIDKVRRAEVKVRPELKGTRYVWAENEPNLTARQSAVLDTLASTNLKTARAWRMRLAFQDVYAQPSAHGRALPRQVDRLGKTFRSAHEGRRTHHAKSTATASSPGSTAASASAIEGITFRPGRQGQSRGYRNSETLKRITYLPRRRNIWTSDYPL